MFPDGDGNTRFAVFMDKTGDLRRLYWDKTMPRLDARYAVMVTVLERLAKFMLHGGMMTRTLWYQVRFLMQRDMPHAEMSVVNIYNRHSVFARSWRWRWRWHHNFGRSEWHYCTSPCGDFETDLHSHHFHQSTTPTQ